MWVVGMAGPNENADRHRGAIVVQAVDGAPESPHSLATRKATLLALMSVTCPHSARPVFIPNLQSSCPTFRSVAMPVTGTAALIAGDCGIFPESSVISPMSWASPLRPSLTDWLKVPMLTYPPPVE